MSEPLAGTGEPLEPLDAEVVADPASLVAPAPSYEEVTGYTRAGEPTLDHVRDKIERRAAEAMGAEEMAAAMPESREFEEFFAEREKAAKAKLDEIRKSMGGAG